MPKHVKRFSISTLLLACAVLIGTGGGSGKAAETRSDTNQSQASPDRSQDGSTLANPSRVLSLRACFDRAQDYNKEIIASRANLPVSKAAIEIASALPNPVFGLQYGFGPAFTIIIAGNPEQFGFVERIQTAGKRSKQINLARANYRAAQLQVAALMFDVHNRVRRAYCELAAAEAYADLIEAQRSVAQELFDIAQKRLVAGKGPHSEVLQAELGVLQFETQRNQR